MFPLQLYLVVGGMVIELLEQMVKAANGRPVILINPNLADRPSSNNMMQVQWGVCPMSVLHFICSSKDRCDALCLYVIILFSYLKAIL